MIEVKTKLNALSVFKVEQNALLSNRTAQEVYQVMMKIELEVRMAEYREMAESPLQDVEMEDQFATGGGAGEDDDVEMLDVETAEVQDVEMGLEN